jgi:fructose-1,6-bisphosphatase II
MTEVDYDKIYGISDMIRGNDTMMAITGVTDGVLLKGVRYVSGGAETSSIVLRHKTHTIREIKARHQFDFKPGF